LRIKGFYLPKKETGQGKPGFEKRRFEMRLHRSAAPLAQSVRTLFAPAYHSRQQTLKWSENGRSFQEHLKNQSRVTLAGVQVSG
jgi:hypothetical protein